MQCGRYPLLCMCHWEREKESARNSTSTSTSTSTSKPNRNSNSNINSNSERGREREREKWLPSLLHFSPWLHIGKCPLTYNFMCVSKWASVRASERASVRACVRVCECASVCASKQASTKASKRANVLACRSLTHEPIQNTAILSKQLDKWLYIIHVDTPRTGRTIAAFQVARGLTIESQLPQHY